MKKYVLIKKADIILILFLMIISFAGINIKNFGSEGSKLKISKDGKIITEVSMSEDKIIEIKNERGEITNKIEIKNERVKMIYADCPDKICENTNPIHRVNETIVCLPNKVIIEIVGETEIDLYTH